jgi:hypothetical protein
MVAPTIARAMLIPPKPATPDAGSGTKEPTPRHYSRREIRAHNAKYEARMMKKRHPPEPMPPAGTEI